MSPKKELLLTTSSKNPEGFQVQTNDRLSSFILDVRQPHTPAFLASSWMLGTPHPCLSSSYSFQLEMWALSLRNVEVGRRQMAKVTYRVNVFLHSQAVNVPS